MRYKQLPLRLQHLQSSFSCRVPACISRGKGAARTTVPQKRTVLPGNGRIYPTLDHRAYPFLPCTNAGEMYACALGNIYTFGPTFRAENSNTARHLAEFWMIEPEMAFADLADDMACAEAYLKHCVRHILQHCSEDLAFFDSMIEKGLIDRCGPAGRAC